MSKCCSQCNVLKTGIIALLSKETVNTKGDWIQTAACQIPISLTVDQAADSIATCVISLAITWQTGWSVMVYAYRITRNGLSFHTPQSPDSIYSNTSCFCHCLYIFKYKHIHNIRLKGRQVPNWYKLSMVKKNSISACPGFFFFFFWNSLSLLMGQFLSRYQKNIPALKPLKRHFATDNRSLKLWCMFSWHRILWGAWAKVMPLWGRLIMEGDA